MIPGSCDSLPGQKGHVGSKGRACAAGFDWGPLSRGLWPRSGAMMTHPSVVGSRRNSLIIGFCGQLLRLALQSADAGPMRSVCRHPSFGSASKRKSGFECTDEIEPFLHQARQQEAMTDGLASTVAELFAELRILDDLDNPSGSLFHGFD
jgi:hypothetical protein